MASHKRLHAEILLKSDISELGDKWRDEQIGDAFGISIRTVARVRERLVTEGIIDGHYIYWGSIWLGWGMWKAYLMKLSGRH